MILDKLIQILEDRVARCDDDPLFCNTCGQPRHTADVMCIKDSCAVVCRECSGTLCTLDAANGVYTLKDTQI